jgi:hypothetical protein
MKPSTAAGPWHRQFGPRLSRWWRGRDVALIYAAIVVTTTTILAIVPRAAATRFVLDSSTNLANLREHPPLVLVLSAFMQPSPVELLILPPLVWAYGALQHWLGRAATIITAVFGHIGATLFVATILAAGIAKGRITTSTAHVADVGASYGLATVAGLLVARVPRRWRTLYTTAISALLAAVLLLDRTFTDLGHAVAWLIGLGLALLVTRAEYAATTQETGRRCGRAPSGHASPASTGPRGDVHQWRDQADSG